MSTAPEQPAVAAGQTLTLVPAETFEPEVTSITERVAALAIETAPQYEQAGALLKNVKALRDKVATTYNPRIKQASDLHRGLIADKKEFDEPLATAEKTLKQGMGAYLDAEERRQAAIAAEAQAEAQEAHENIALEEAAALERAGDPEAAARVMKEAEAGPIVPAPPPAATKISGVSTRTKWVPEVTDKLALVKAVAKGKVPLALLDVNMKALRKQADALGQELNYPGITVKKDRVIAAGKR
jgi:hypothetical protein